MRPEDAHDLISGIDDCFISEAMPGRFRQKHSARKWFAAAACFIAIVGIIGGSLYGAALRLPDVEGKLEKKQVTAVAVTTDIFDASCLSAPSIVFEYPVIKYRGGSYIGQKAQPRSGDMGKKLDTAPTEDGNEVVIRKINGVSSDYAVAVAYDADTPGGIYINAGYSPTSLEKLLRDTGLERGPFITSAFYYYRDGAGAAKTAEFEITDEASVWQRLFSSDKKLSNATAGNEGGVMLTITASLSALGNSRAVFRIDADGNATVELPEYRAAFSIGKLRARSIARYITENFHGYELAAAE